MSRRGATGLRGILPIDKPAGMTSHDVVARIRRATGEGRVGHAGTLDPAATGLLVVLIGPYTRLEPYLSSAQKCYEARITFGSETDTDDAEGAVVRRAEPPAQFADETFAASVLAGFTGPSLQVPPAYSAIKVEGRTAHRAARGGQPLDLEPRSIEVMEAALLSIDPVDASWNVRFSVSKGTYIRALARDVGRACNSAAHLSSLRRTASGMLSLDDAARLDRAETEIAAGNIERLLIDPLRALGLPVIQSPAGSTLNGRTLSLPPTIQLVPGQMAAVAEEGRLAAVYRYSGESLVPVVVLPQVNAA